MNDDFSGPLEPSSLTESLEMAMEVERRYSRLPCFSCASDVRGGGKGFSVDSYLAGGSLKRYVKVEISHLALGTFILKVLLGRLDFTKNFSVT